MKVLAARRLFPFGILISLVAVLGQVGFLCVPGLSLGAQVLLAWVIDIAMAFVLLTSFD